MTEELTVKTGQGAIEHMTDSWQEAFHGMAQIDVIDPWFKVSRSGAEYACYISLVDGTAVTVFPDDAPRDSDEWVPNDLYPDGLIDDDARELLAEAFGHENTGSYPMPDEGQFWMGFKDDEGRYKRLVVGLTDDTMEITEDS